MIASPTEQADPYRQHLEEMERLVFSLNIVLEKARAALDPATEIVREVTPAPLAPEPVVLDLTKRELEILRLTSNGHSNAHMARMLWITEQTVKFHLSNVYKKLNVGNRTEAGRYAQVHGLLEQEEE